jgi:hypothetical protein
MCVALTPERVEMLSYLRFPGKDAAWKRKGTKGGEYITRMEATHMRTSSASATEARTVKGKQKTTGRN